ncbi:MAG: NUDIX domain-containing protein [Candidatus Levybacteria bacterium]|nr:NUDIX domain-containing protein [Candidatus Levybacteria bacterium]MBI3069907.1 NUDIX domain-containing protein [Candidatus Levybacteria bacterium]MBI3092846.1 NUDIX domain-containing protein [Candidatus Levybacteria bacterium]
MERFKLHAAVFLILQKGKKVLLQRRFQTGHQDGNYGLISGHLERDEPATQTLVREAKEEAGIIVNSKHLKLKHVMHKRGDPAEYINIFYLSNTWEGKPKIMEEDKCDDLSWFPVNKLPKNTISYIKKAIENIKKEIFYSEFGW